MRATTAASAGLGALVVALVGAPAADAQVVLGMTPIAEDPPVTMPEIEAALAPHGDWIDLPGGMGRAWRPDVTEVGEDFTPYLSNGRWVYGALGWTFDSQYAWGWAAFHFGRWLFQPDHGGWVWTAAGAGPSPIWGPAWVAWRTGGGFVGWLPLAPAGAIADPHQYASLWSVVQLRHLQRADLARHLFPPERIAHSNVVAPPGVGAPVVPLPGWRGYPNLRAAIAVANGAVLVTPSFAPGANPTLWMGRGSSVHAPVDMGYASGASSLWTGPGSSVHASPAFGSPAPGQQARGWNVAPAPTRRLGR